VYEPNLTVEYDSIDVYGTLAPARSATLDIRCVNLRIHPGGELVLTPQAGATQRIVIRDVPLDSADLEQVCNGMLAYGGRVILRGQYKTPFLRLASELVAGQIEVAVEQPPVGWEVGDRLVFAQSHQWFSQTYPYSPGTEEAVVAAINGATVTLAAPLQFSHPGARNGDGVLEFLPHVGNLTRNLVVKSENAAGTRGHTMYTALADVAIENCEFRGLGRTTNLPGSRIGRYPVHFHHLIGAAQANGHRFTFTDNSVFCGMPDHNFRWGVAIHGSHYGKVGGNVLYNWAGAALATEDGSESYNVIEGNFCVRTRGFGGRLDNGNEGQAFWFRGPNNYVRDNVAADAYGSQFETAYGYKYFMYYLGNVRIPNFPGADTSQEGQYTVKNGNALPLLEFARNEVYACENGLTFWWLNAEDTAPQNGGESIVRDTRVWHVSHYGMYGYPMADVTFDGYVVRGNRSLLSNVHEGYTGMWFGDYMAKNVKLIRGDIQGMRTGFVDPYFSGYPTLIQDSHFRCNYDIRVVTPGAPGSAPWGPNRGPKSLVVRNTTHGPTAGWNFGGSNARLHVAMSYTLHGGAANLTASDTVYVYDYNGVAGENYQVYYPEQAASFIVPQGTGPLAGSPVAGLTNQQNWDQYGLAIAGAVAPADVMVKSWTNGLVR
jgi:hypothetical protein